MAGWGRKKTCFSYGGAEMLCAVYEGMVENDRIFVPYIPLPTILVL